MAVEIFDEELGAQPHILFGCTVRSVVADLGLSDNASSVTIVVVREEDQDFSFQPGITPSQGIKNLTSINIGAFNFVGIVESWQETFVGTQGSGIFEIKLTDAKIVLDDSTLSLFSEGNDPNNPSGPFIIDDFGISPFNPLNSVIEIPSDRFSDFSTMGFRFDPIALAIEAAEVQFGDNSFKIDLSEVQDIIASRSSHPDDIDSAYRILGIETSVAQFIATAASDFDFDWYVDILHDEIADINIIKIRVIDRSKVIVPSDFDMDGLTALHSNRVISRKQGFENTPGDDAIRILSGGMRQTLTEYSGDVIRPFWGWTLDSGKFSGIVPEQPDDEFPLSRLIASTSTAFTTSEVNERSPFIPLDSPGFHMPGTSQFELFSTTTEEMKLALDGDLDGIMPDRELTSLKNYARNHWGRQFYIPIPTIDWDASRDNTWVNVVNAGWWESDIGPGGVDIQINRPFLDKFGTQFGRWTAFMKLPNLNSLAGGPFQWGGIMNKGTNIVYDDRDLYMKVLVTKIEHFWIIRMIDPLIIETESGDFDRVIDMDSATLWSPQSDARLFYGPWSNVDDIPIDQRPQGATRLTISKYLTPWLNGFPGITHTEGITALDKIGRAKASQFKPLKTHVDTGHLEVADLPAVNIGTRFGDGGVISNISMSFTVAGVKTRYSIGLFSIITKRDKAINAKIKKLQDIVQDNLRDNINHIRDAIPIDILRVIPLPPEVINDELIPEFPVDEEFFDVMLGKPEGGKGKIISSNIDGPFYTIERLNARQLTEGFGSLIDLALVPEWTSVRNLAEKDNSPGLLPIGQIVTVSIYEDTIGGAEPFIEVTPPNFAPPQ